MSIRPINFRTSFIKTLSTVEVDPSRSNQHEFNGVAQLKRLFGDQKVEMFASFSVRGSDRTFISKLTWYDAREMHPTRSEYRLYFQTNPVMDQANAGDNIVIGFDTEGEIHCELIKKGSVDYKSTPEWVKF
ncbi:MULTISPECIES: type II restriction endonuclease [Aeromonas]|uniref:type II restriction endonuclease n=1 Tax=Aeromonas TaxID=642 RepID=UPI0009EDDDC9|nr:type II restriction endonuclease [Aeromonas enteropelogenes]